METKRAFDVFYKIRRQIRKLEEEGGLPQELTRQSDNPDETLKSTLGMSILGKLEDISYMMDWLEKPIAADGVLAKNHNGRYGVQDIELTSGHPLEVWDEEYKEWSLSRIEYDNDYYITSLGRDKSIEGVRVRIRY
ncbi:DUF5348 domain-containing protein [Shouchella clausii]|uniref:DUF5348 domain-containing protein n=1 Tax=Shouchella clausii TaxID=79880 RepID=UPI001C739551|nr:DUF5348 domain-containing protein [Shouchella clausii]MBX0320341.1 DUF5348 domain-containing protein [Shouchella clausii]MEB5480895.1 DUF5348 domain-containing protein [Shouchella clausii]